MTVKPARTASLLPLALFCISVEELFPARKHEIKHQTEKRHTGRGLKDQSPGSGLFQDQAADVHADNAGDRTGGVGDTHQRAGMARRNVHVIDVADEDGTDGQADQCVASWPSRGGSQNVFPPRRLLKMFLDADIEIAAARIDDELLRPYLRYASSPFSLADFLLYLVPDMRSLILIARTSGDHEDEVASAELVAMEKTHGV